MSDVNDEDENQVNLDQTSLTGHKYENEKARSTFLKKKTQQMLLLSNLYKKCTKDKMPAGMNPFNAVSIRFRGAATLVKGTLFKSQGKLF